MLHVLWSHYCCLLAAMLVQRLQRMNVVVLLVVTLMAATSAADLEPPALCGSWSQNCVALQPSGSQSGVWFFDGISVGAYTFSASTFSTDNCTGLNQTLQVVHEGSYQDLGPNIGMPGARLLKVVPAFFTVTVYDSEVAALLQFGCPCNGLWQVGVERGLSACPPGTCPDTTFLGGASDQGIVVGEAMYGNTAVDGPTLAVSPFSADSTASYSFPPNTNASYSQDTGKCVGLVASLYMSLLV